MDREQLLNDSENALRTALDGRQAQMWTSMPGIVVSVDLAAMTAVIQPAIMGVSTNADDTESFVKMPLLLDVPIQFPQAGGFALTLPIVAGDEVLVVFASRCIDSWWQSGGQGVPMEARMHDLSDGFCIPGICSKPNVLPNISAVNAQLRTKDGNTYIEITPDGKINIKAAGGVKVTGDLNVTGEVIAKFGAFAPIPLSTHIHSGVTTGGGSTGGPLP